MTQPDKQGAAETLATIHARQERARRAARLPWWAYAGMFILTAGGTAALDFVDLNGAKLSAIVVLVLFIAVFAVTFATRSAPLSWARGVQPRQSFNPAVFVIMAVLVGLIIVLSDRYGTGFAHRIASTVGLHDYPNTVAGVLYGVVFTALFALGRMLVETFQRPARR